MFMGQTECSSDNIDRARTGNDRGGNKTSKQSHNKNKYYVQQNAYGMNKPSKLQFRIEQLADIRCDNIDKQYRYKH